MKRLVKKIILYILFFVASMAVAFFGSIGVADLISDRFENQIRISIANKNTLKKYCANEGTYNALKDLHHPKVNLNTGDQGSGNIIYFPVNINNHYYDVEYQGKYSPWQYYAPVTLKEIKRR